MPTLGNIQWIDGSSNPEKKVKSQQLISAVTKWQMVDFSVIPYVANSSSFKSDQRLPDNQNDSRINMTITTMTRCWGHNKIIMTDDCWDTGTKEQAPSPATRYVKTLSTICLTQVHDTQSTKWKTHKPWREIRSCWLRHRTQDLPDPSTQCTMTTRYNVISSTVLPHLKHIQ